LAFEPAKLLPMRDGWQGLSLHPSCRQDCACLSVWQKQSPVSVSVAAANLPTRPSGILFAKTLPAIPHAHKRGLIKVQMRLFAELGFSQHLKASFMHTRKLSRLMKLSWDIQRSKRHSRSKSLTAAWAIIGNEDITVFYLTRRLNHHKPVKQTALHQMGLFMR